MGPAEKPTGSTWLLNGNNDEWIGNESQRVDKKGTQNGTFAVEHNKDTRIQESERAFTIPKKNLQSFYMRIGNTSDSQPSNLTEESKKDRGLDASKCLICSESYKKSINDHLLYGSVQCKDCIWEADSCMRFAKYKHLCRYGCQHTQLKWNFDVVQDIMQRVKCEKNAGATHIFLDAYLKKTRGLEHYDPWREAFQYFKTLFVQLSTEIGFQKKSISNNCLRSANKKRYFIEVHCEEKQKRKVKSPTPVLKMKHLSVILHRIDEKSNALTIKPFKLPTNHLVSKLNDKNLKECLVDASSASSRNCDDESYTNFIVTRKHGVMGDDNNHSKFDIPEINKSHAPGQRSTDVPTMGCDETLNREVSDKFNVMVFGSSQESSDTTQPSATNSNSRLHNNFMLTKVVCDYCPNCSSELYETGLIVNINIGLLIVKCHGCEIHVCIDPFPREIRNQLGLSKDRDEIIEILQNKYLKM